ncbi:MAG TPA: hypothetical protein DCW90_12925 [Lachnospiraceae bacterium]|nr:hypothetical protein [Lachnospiraceae bacterium]
MTNEILTNLVYTFILFGISILGIFLKSYVIPLIKAKMEQHNITITQDQIEVAKQVVSVLVESAYRLGIAGKLDYMKTYVMTQAKTQLRELGIELTDEMLDNIRRAALVEWEATVKEINDNEPLNDEG